MCYKDISSVCNGIIYTVDTNRTLSVKVTVVNKECFPLSYKDNFCLAPMGAENFRNLGSESVTFRSYRLSNLYKTHIETPFDFKGKVVNPMFCLYIY